MLWGPLCRFYGGFDQINGGDPNDALLDLTGGLTEFKALDAYKNDMKEDRDYDGAADVPLFLMLVRMRRMSSLLCCFTKVIITKIASHMSKGQETIRQRQALIPRDITVPVWLISA